MSGDHGPRVTVPAALHALRGHPHLSLQLVGDSSTIHNQIDASGQRGQPHAERLDIVQADYTIPMHARPAEFLRAPADSAIHLALELLASGRVEGVVSAGNTAALLALSRRQVGMLGSCKRAALCSAIPVREGSTYMLDLGANIDCTAGDLLEFALMGAALARALNPAQPPRVGLLSNGREDTKGNAAIRGAAELLAADDRINYCGFVEGDDLHRGLVDVIVCDGLLGNVALKVAEGTAALARDIIAETLGRHWWGRLIRSRAEAMQRSLDADRHGGALLLGLQGVVVKSHGSSSEAAFGAALGLAASCVGHGLTRRMADYLRVQEV